MSHHSICKYVIGVKQDPGSNSQLRDERCERMLFLLCCCVIRSEVIKNNSNSGEPDINHCGVKYDILVEVQMLFAPINYPLRT